jgi:heme/copper-type cytochrome/quinol oxidase subunit 2
VGFVVDKVTSGLAFTEYFGSPANDSFHRLLQIIIIIIVVIVIIVIIVIIVVVIIVINIIYHPGLVQ